MTYLTHVTIPTGHTRRSERSEIQPHTWHVMSSILHGALALQSEGLGVELPIDGGYEFRIDAIHGKCLRSVVLSPQKRIMVYIGVCVRSRCSANLWATLHEYSGYPETGPAPPSPWVAAAIMPAMVGDQAVHWLGDFERCIGWAWKEYCAAEMNS